MEKTAVVLVNIGTPESPEAKDVGPYLQEFLMDPDVISIPFPLRWFLVNVLIVPKRKHKSAEAYQQIWTDEGSPLMVYMKGWVENMNKHLPENYDGYIAMRYGNPSLVDLWPKLSDYDRVLVVPAFPQWAKATSGSVEDLSKKLAKKHNPKQKVEFFPEFFSDERFVDSLCETIDRSKFDHLLFSFHGLPESHILEADKSQSHCLKHNSCCETFNEKNSFCYRAQCYETARLVAKKANITDYSVSFQSRLGKTPWIRPYTDEWIEDLLKKGVKRIGVICPAFVVDCLETLEEIGIGLKEKFIEGGGESFQLIPCLNDGEKWSERFAEMVSKN